nr:DUF4224 domain-containing protein [Pseudomonas nicosulfuronedens]
MVLTAIELVELSGYRKPSAQARWLERNGFPFVMGGDGQPKVLRQAVEGRLGGKLGEKKREPQLRLRSGQQPLQRLSTLRGLSCRMMFSTK